MDQWRLFAKLVRERNPKAIAIDVSADHNFADGLTVGEWEQMKAALGPDLEARIVRNPRLAIDYLALRVPSMAPVYRRLQTIVHEVISAAFSNLVITPGRHVFERHLQLSTSQHYVFFPETLNARYQISRTCLPAAGFRRMNNKQKEN